MSNEFSKYWGSEATVNTQWHLCTLDYESNLPTESGLYLVIGTHGFEVLPFYMEGDVLDESNVDALGISRKVVAITSSFYKEGKNIPYEKTNVTAWTKLPENTSNFLEMFKKGES